MNAYSIQIREGDEYIVSQDPEFTIKVIPTKMWSERTYIPYTTVFPIFEDDFKEANTQVLEAMESDKEIDEDLAEELWDELDEGESTFDFQGVDIDFVDDDLPSCNKQLWIDAINFYCKTKLGETVIAVRCHGYNYELSEWNCKPDVLKSLQ